MKYLVIKNNQCSVRTLDISVSVVESERCFHLRLIDIKTDLEICVELALHPSGASSWQWFCAPIDRMHGVPLVMGVYKKRCRRMRPPVAVGVAIQDNCLHLQFVTFCLSKDRSMSTRLTNVFGGSFLHSVAFILLVYISDTTHRLLQCQAFLFLTFH
jgi:hypothetical protein